MKKRQPQLVSGTIQIADHQGRFPRAPEPGGVLVVDLHSLDDDYAHTLAAWSPVAVLNVAEYSSLFGGKTLLDAGVVLLDDLGGDVLELREGDAVEIAPTTGEVIRGSELVASGRTIFADALEKFAVQNRQTLPDRVQARALVAARDFTREQNLILDGDGLPPSSVKLEGRVVLISTPTSDLESRRHQVRTFVGDYNPVIIAVGTGVDALRAVGLTPQIVVGDPRDMDLERLRKVRQVLVPTVEDVHPADELMKRHSIAFTPVATSLSAVDVALLFAGFRGASTIVDCSSSTGLADSLDGSGLGNLLTRAQLEDRLVTLDAALALYRPRLSIWWVLALALVVVLALATALLFTPWGTSVVGLWMAGGIPVALYTRPEVGFD